MARQKKITLKIVSEQIQNLGVEKIQEQLQRILGGSEFYASYQQRKFFEFVVKETLSGRAHEIKAYTIATCVFDRSDDFDQNSDPIVSVQANRLRRALERYYLISGQNDPVIIDIPKGGYVPTFQRQGDVDLRKTQHDEDITQWDKDAWPKLLVKAFKNLTKDPELDSISVGIATELAVEIARHQELRVIFAPASKREVTYAAESSVGFVLDGTVQKDTASIKVSFALTDTATNIRFWGDSFTAPFDPSKLISFQEEVANTIACKILSEQGVIPEIMSNESRINASVGFSTYDAILKYYAFAADFCADNFFKAFEALTLATENDPRCGLAWAMLARLYGDNYALEIFDLETPIEDAALFSERGGSMEPSNQRVRLISAYVDFLNNDLDASEAEIIKALELNPNSLLFLENIGYLMTLLGDWKQGPALIKKAIKLNPYYYHFTSNHALWVDWIRQGDYEQAYRETMNFKKATLFWEPLMKAASCGLLGNIARGKRFADDLFRLKPEFRKRGRTLIRHYIKFDDIYERIIKGLNNVGVQVE